MVFSRTLRAIRLKETLKACLQRLCFGEPRLVKGGPTSSCAIRANVSNNPAKMSGTFSLEKGAPQRVLILWGRSLYSRYPRLVCFSFGEWSASHGSLTTSTNRVLADFSHL